MIKQLIIPAAAFLVTATAVSAYNPDWLENLDIDLTDDQVSALEEAHEIRQAADEEARQVLMAAGLDDNAMREIRSAMRTERAAHHQAVEAALEAGDYDAFKVAVADSPIADVINSEADFEKFKEAHDLREAGEAEAAAAIMSELGLEGREGGMKGGHRGERGNGAFGGPGLGD